MAIPPDCWTKSSLLFNVTAAGVGRTASPVRVYGVGELFVGELAAGPKLGNRAVKYGGIIRAELLYHELLDTLDPTNRMTEPPLALDAAVVYLTTRYGSSMAQK